MSKETARLKKLQDELLRILGEYPELSAFISLITKEGHSMYVGNGCVVCAIKLAVMWMIENDIKHEDGTSESDNIVFVPPTSDTVN